MNKRTFDSLIKRGGLKQDYGEWKIFLEFCSQYLKDHKIKYPIVVELGVLNNRQKAFYEQLLDAEHIGIDIHDKKSKPDIHGDSHDPKTLAKLMRKLDGRPIDILFIDAAHKYEDVTKDFEMYSPLCTGIVAFHDTETFRNTSRQLIRVWQFWDEMKSGTYEGAAEYKQYPLISIFKRRKGGSQRGTGIMVKG